MKKQLTAEQVAQSEARRAAFRAVCDKLAKLPEAERLTLAAQVLVQTVEGHTLSGHNQCLVALQAPGATLVGGFVQWLKHGRVVRKGEHGISIWIPTARKGAEQDSGDGEDGKRTGFIMGSVFDVSQTEVRG